MAWNKEEDSGGDFALIREVLESYLELIKFLPEGLFVDAWHGANPGLRRPLWKKVRPDALHEEVLDNACPSFLPYV